MSLLERTIKMVLATVLAIIIAEYLGLTYALSAGLISLLSVLDTRQTSLMVAKNRLLAFVIAFAIAITVFFFLGYGLIAFALYLVLAVPLLYYFKIESGLVPITVLVTHLMTSQSLAFSILLNEFAIFAIGTGLALLLNIYMGSNDSQIKAFHQTIEQKMKAILYQLEDCLLHQNGQELNLMVRQLDLDLDAALQLVYRESDNKLFQQTNYQVHYFEMRRRQNTLLKQMVKTSLAIKEPSRESILLSRLFHETAKQLSEKNSAVTLIDDIEQLLEVYRQRELPQSRQEFEMRALLFQLLQDLERFITEKTSFYHDYKNDTEYD